MPAVVMQVDAADQVPVPVLGLEISDDDESVHDRGPLPFAVASEPARTPVAPARRACDFEQPGEPVEAIELQSADRDNERSALAPAPLPRRKKTPSLCKGPVAMGCLVLALLAFGITMTQVSCVDKCGEHGSCGGFACRCNRPYSGKHCDEWLNGTPIDGG